MTINVVQSHSVEILLEAMLRQVNQPADNLFEIFQTQSFIVPNKSVEKWLVRKVAEKTGVSANYEFYNRIHAFQWGAYQAVIEDKEKVRQANMPRIIMKWRIFEALKEFIEPNELKMHPRHELFSIISRIYESSSNMDTPDEALSKRHSMLYWVAEQSSRLFLNYIAYRGQCEKHHEGCDCGANWLDAWGQNQPIDVEALFNRSNDETDEHRFQQAQDLEAWQRWLWVNLFHEDYQLFREVDKMFWHEVETPEKRLEVLSKLPKELIVFTVLDLPPHQLNFLRRLGQYLDVVIYHYNPSQEYWADAVDARWKKQYDLGIKERFIEQNKLKGKAVTDEEIKSFFEHFSANFSAEIRESRHPLLTRLGKQARDHFSLLSKLSSGEEGQWFDLFFDEEKDTLLGKVQSDILNLLEPVKHGYTLREDDNSIRVNVCHSGLRQLETLKEQVVHWLAQGTEENPRKPDDILVLTPNIKTLEPLVRSVFSPLSKNGQGADVYLPVKITGVPQTNIKNAWNSVLGRLKLAQGRFHYDEFADWLSLGSTQKLYELDYSQVERMLGLLKDAQFKRGFDDQHLKLTVCEDDSDFRFSFKYAIDRLMLGVAVDQHVPYADTLCFDSVQSGDFELVAKLIQIYEDLNHRRTWLSPNAEKLTTEQWLEVILEEIKEYQEKGELHLTVVMDVIQSFLRPLTLTRYYDYVQKKHQKSLTHMQLPLNYLVQEIQSAFESQLDAAEPSGQITFAQMGSIRPLPYKLVVMLNMDSGVFPNLQHAIPFDLMRYLRQQLGDRSRLEDEQGAFLDSVLLAKENLWIFYNGFDVASGLSRQPSSLVQEFVDHLASITAIGTDDELGNYVQCEGVEVFEHLAPLYQIHTLLPFDAKGFKPESIRFKNQWFRVANKIQVADDQSASWSEAVYTNFPQVDSLPSSRWVNELVFPAQLYLNAISVKNIQPQDLVPENEPILLNGLDRYAVRDFLHSTEKADPILVSDKLPVSKLMQSAWQVSQSEHQSAIKRLSIYAESPTKIKGEAVKLKDGLSISINVPDDENCHKWVVLKASSAYAEHRAKVWIEYLLWLAYLNLGDEGTDRQMVVVFNNSTVVSEGVSSNQAKQFLDRWVDAWKYGQKQPLVLPATLILSPLEKGKNLTWSAVEGTGEIIIEEMADLVGVWNETYERNPSFPLTENRSNKKHRDWSYILLNRNSTALLKEACEKFSFDLYEPIYRHQHTVKD